MAQSWCCVGMKDVDYSLCEPVDDDELSALHALAFGHGSIAVPWTDRLHSHSLFWVTASRHGALIGFVNVVGDGGAHAFLLDLCVHPEAPNHSIGPSLVRAAADQARRRGCHWLHADYEPELRRFYEQHCGLQPTAAGLFALRREST